MAEGNDALVTAETVAAAAETIAARGERPSVQAVRRELGGGSPNRVLEHLRAWKAAREEAAPEAAPAQEAPAGEGVVATMDALPEVGPAVDGLVHAVLAAVGRVQTAERRTAEERVTSLLGAHAEELAAHDRRHAESLAAVEARLADANAELEEALPSVAEAEALRSRVATLESEGRERQAAADAEQARLRERIGALESDLRTAQGALSEAVEGRQAAVAAAERADGEARAWREQLARAQEEVAEVRREAAAAAERAQAALDAVRGELAEAHAAARAQGERIDSLRREAEHGRAEVERLRAARDASDGRVQALVERAAQAEAKLATAEAKLAAAAAPKKAAAS